MANIKALKLLGAKKTRYDFKVNPKVLETFPNPRKVNTVDDMILIPFVMPQIEFTSLCPKTGQPDFAKIEIVYVPREKMVESKSLKLYLFSYRNYGAFHEECASQICDDLFKLLDPIYMRVIGDFTPRGGIAIKPIVKRWNTTYTAQPYLNSVLSMVHQFDVKGLGI